MFGFINGALAAVKGVSSLLKNAKGKDAERVKKAAESLALARGGDQTARAWIDQQRITSATKIGRQAYQMAWDELNSGGNSVAGLSAIATTLEADDNGIKTALQAELDALRAQVAGAVQRIGSGIVTTSAETVAGDANAGFLQQPVTIPTNTGTILAALAVGAVVLFVAGKGN